MDVDDGKHENAPLSKVEQFSFSTVVSFFNMLETIRKSSHRAGTGAGKRKRGAVSYPEMLAKALERLLGTKTFGDDAVRMDMYPLLRLLLPAIDEERRNFNLKSKKLAEVFIEAISLVGPEAKALQNPEDALLKQNLLRKCNLSHEVLESDFGSVLHVVLRSKSFCERESRGKDPTVKEINDLLDEITRLHKKEERVKLFKTLFTDKTADELFWLTRIILGDMRLQLTVGRVLPVFHEQGLAVYRRTTSIHKVCLCAIDADMLNECVSTIKLNRPFQPMHAFKAPDWSNSLKNLAKHEELLMEPKLDGERMLIHKDGENYKLLSRSGQDVGKKYDYVSAIQPFLKKATHSVDKCVLDGELLCYSGSQGRYLPFGSLRPGVSTMEKSKYHTLSAEDRKNKDRVVFICWDVCMVDNKQSIDWTLRQRKEWMRKNLVETAKEFELNEVTNFDRKNKSKQECNEELMVHLDDYMARGFEGMVIKSWDSKYLIGERKGTHWVKLKPDQINGYGDTLDMLILGGYYGTRNKGVMSKFIVGVKTYEHSNTENVEYRTLGKVGTGYSFAELRELTEKLTERGLVRQERDGPLPSWFGNWDPSEKDNRPDFVIPPHQSIVLEVRVFELIRCEKSKFSAMIGFRHPRVMRIRYDKPWNEALTLTEAQAILKSGAATRKNGSRTGLQAQRQSNASQAYSQMSQSSLGHGFTQMMTQDMASLPAPPSPSKRGSEHYGPDLNFTPQINLFNGYRFHIHLAGRKYKGWTKHDLEVRVKELGGVVVANAISSVKDKKTGKFPCIADAILVDRESRWAKNHEDCGMDVCFIDFLLECHETETLVEFEPKHVLYPTQRTLETFEGVYNEFGDYVAKVTTRERLLGAVKMSIAKKRRLREEKMQEMGLDALPALPSLATVLKRLPERPREAILKLKMCMFVELVFCVVVAGADEGAASFVDTHRGILCERQLKYYGGTVSPDVTQAVTHIVVIGNLDEASRANLLKLCAEHRDRTMPVKPMVTYQFVGACIAKGHVVETAFFSAFGKSS